MRLRDIKSENLGGVKEILKNKSIDYIEGDNCVWVTTKNFGFLIKQKLLAEFPIRSYNFREI